jgi:putative phosphoesterase
MKIGVVGDTHGSPEALQKIFASFSDVELFFHTGDHWQDGLKIEKKMGIPVYTVKGNCDRGEMSGELFIELNNKKFFVTHGHQYGVKYGLDVLASRAMQLKADYCIFGHTHKPVIEKMDEIWYLNPGSIIWPRGSNVCCGIIMDYQDNSFISQFVYVDIG